MFLRTASKTKPLAALFSLLLLSACAWVNVTPEAAQIKIVTPDATTGCQRIGVVSANTKAKLLGVPRKEHIVTKELDDLARQQAVSMGANTLVRQTVVEGKGSYTAYLCP